MVGGKLEEKHEEPYFSDGVNAGYLRKPELVSTSAELCRDYPGQSDGVGLGSTDPGAAGVSEMPAPGAKQRQSDARRRSESHMIIMPPTRSSIR